MLSCHYPDTALQLPSEIQEDGRPGIPAGSHPAYISSAQYGLSVTRLQQEVLAADYRRVGRAFPQHP